MTVIKKLGSVKMKIDLHCHTKKIKKGDSINRAVTKELFAEKIFAADVKIVAITNHNHFDYKQYNDFKNAVAENCQVWPGIELDVLGLAKEGEKAQRGHLIVIANPKNVELFSKSVNNAIGNIDPNEFIMDLKNVYDTFNECDVLYIPHFHKKPSLLEEDLNYFNDLLVDKSRLFKEASDYRTIGVYSNFDYSMIIGSDVQDWRIYEKSNFSDIRLHVETFEQFCLLAKKDVQIIDTLLNTKKKNEVTVHPSDNIDIKIPVYEDVNIIFGQKGTGKTEIIKSLKNHYEETGIKNCSYIGTEKDDDFQKLLSTKDLIPDTEKMSMNRCSDCFVFIKDWNDSHITSLNRYIEWTLTKDNNANKKKMKLTNAVLSMEVEPDKKITEQHKNIGIVLSNLDKIPLDDYLTTEDVSALRKLIYKLAKSIEDKRDMDWVDSQATHFTNWSIEKIKSIADKCSNTVSKPSTTGFIEFASNRLKLFENCKMILDELSKEEVNEQVLIGMLDEKGEIFIQTKYRLLCPASRKIEYSSNQSIRKLKDTKSLLEQIAEDIFNNNINSKITEFAENYESGIKDTSNFIGIIKQVVLSDGTVYNPSNGERGILLLQGLLDSNADVYLLDEPELGMGNSYITAAVLPKIVNLARQNKTVIIATHNANIAVKTLPYLSIFRTHKNGEYNTYVGNPFSDKLINIDDNTDVKSWTDESMHTLEGGREAFYERKDIYESGY